jgi:cytochrome P450
MRSLVSKGFTPRRVRELEGDILRLTRRYLEPAVAGGEFDAVADFAGRLPMDVISEMMGVPETDRDEVRRLADLLVHREDGLLDVPPAGMEAALVLAGYYEELLEEKRRHPGEDLTSALLSARDEDGDRLSENEIIAFLFLMVVAGNETTTKLLANAAFWGHKNPDQLAPIYDDPAQVPLWVEETLRYDTSSQILARTVSGDLTLYDTTIPAGDVLVLLPGSAHRDDRVFDDPDSYIIGRDIGSKLMSFGSGAHFCLGAHLARMEARVALSELFKRIRSYEVDEDNAVRVHSSNVRGFAHLPISVEVA